MPNSKMSNATEIEVLERVSRALEDTAIKLSYGVITEDEAVKEIRIQALRLNGVIDMKAINGDI